MTELKKLTEEYEKAITDIVNSDKMSRLEMIANLKIVFKNYKKQLEEYLYHYA
jgi:hypothetical protein